MCNEYEYKKEECETKRKKKNMKKRNINGQKCIEPPASIFV